MFTAAEKRRIEMARKKITEEMGEQEKWYDQAKKVTTLTLPAFIKHLTKDYEHDYGTIAHAVTAAGLAAMMAVVKEYPIEAQQANFIMWTFIYQWMYPQNKCGLAMLNYDNLLFPQMESQFDKIIPAEVFKVLQDQAKDLLENGEDIHEDVKAHLQSIIDGQPPFGFKIADPEA